MSRTVHLSCIQRKINLLPMYFIVNRPVVLYAKQLKLLVRWDLPWFICFSKHKIYLKHIAPQLRYQKCLDAHPESRLSCDSNTPSKGLGATLKNLMSTWTTKKDRPSWERARSLQVRFMKCSINMGVSKVFVLAFIGRMSVHFITLYRLPLNIQYKHLNHKHLFTNKSRIQMLPETSLTTLDWFTFLYFLLMFFLSFFVSFHLLSSSYFSKFVIIIKRLL